MKEGKGGRRREERGRRRVSKVISQRERERESEGEHVSL